MAHSAELIQKIRCIVEQDYPPDTCRYAIEKQIPGTRMSPDILVSCHKQMLCAVEIGYTRPEKLTAYRDQLRIPDVRWYDKQGGLHADVKEVAIALTVQTEPARQTYTYWLQGQVQCPYCAEDPEGPSDGDVLTTLVTDYTRVWAPCFCDECGLAWFADAAEAGHLILNLESPSEFARVYGGRTETGWADCVDLVRDRLGLELHYEDGLFVDPAGHRKWGDSLLTLRRKVVQGSTGPPNK